MNMNTGNGTKRKFKLKISPALPLAFLSASLFLSCLPASPPPVLPLYDTSTPLPLSGITVQNIRENGSVELDWALSPALYRIKIQVKDLLSSEIKNFFPAQGADRITISGLKLFASYDLSVSTVNKLGTSSDQTLRKTIHIAEYTWNDFEKTNPPQNIAADGGTSPGFEYSTDVGGYTQQKSLKILPNKHDGETKLKFTFPADSGKTARLFQDKKYIYFAFRPSPSGDMPNVFFAINQDKNGGWPGTFALPPVLSRDRWNVIKLELLSGTLKRPGTNDIILGFKKEITVGGQKKAVPLTNPFYIDSLTFMENQ